MNGVVEVFSPQLLTPGVLLYLRRAKMLDDAEVVSAELRRMQSGLELLREEERVALLLSDEYAEIDPLLICAMGERELSPAEREVILIARLNRIREEWDELTEPGFYVESEIDDWDSSGEYDVVRFSSPSPPGERGMASYLARLDRHIQKRLALLNS